MATCCGTPDSPSPRGCLIPASFTPPDKSCVTDTAADYMTTRCGNRYSDRSRRARCSEGARFFPTIILRGGVVCSTRASSLSDGLFDLARRQSGVVGCPALLFHRGCAGHCRPGGRSFSAARWIIAHAALQPVAAHGGGSADRISGTAGFDQGSAGTDGRSSMTASMGR